MTGLFDLYAAHPFWAWIALGAALLAIEVATGSGWLLWPAASAAAAGVLAQLFHLSPAAAMLAFAGLTIVSTLLARRYVPRSLATHAHDINDNVARLIGQEGRAVASFVDGAGRVFIDGKEWPAELDDGEAVRAGAALRVVGVHGVRLRVRPAQG